LTVSGLPQREDHQLAVEALREHLAERKASWGRRGFRPRQRDDGRRGRDGAGARRRSPPL